MHFLNPVFVKYVKLKSVSYEMIRIACFFSVEIAMCHILLELKKIVLLVTLQYAFYHRRRCSYLVHC